MAKKKYYQKSQRKMEREDFGMIKADHSACANLPQQVIMKDFPSTTFFDHTDLGKSDNVRGIDKQMDEDTNQASRHKSKSKY